MIIEEKRPLKDGLPPLHPGEFLAEDIAEMKMSPCEFDAVLAVCPGTTALLVDECADVTPELALRLARYFGTTARFWLGLQADYEVKIIARRQGKAIAAQVRPLVDYGSGAGLPFGIGEAAD